MFCTRKKDLAYLFFFLTHIPIILCTILYAYLHIFTCANTNTVIDTVPLQPSILQTNLSHQLRDFYITTYRDKFFENPPTWFTVFIWMELLYHLPLSIWAVRGLLKDHPLVPVHLLVFGIQAFITTLTSLVVVWSWTDRSVAEKQQLTMLYAPYMALGGFMALDMVFRLRDKLMPKSKRE
ncbi:Transmembrane protein 6/97 [Penicillium cf. griseofulvum]|nr:Transmembrane protein 6/97 [Penicillium cf. griseofulvum]